MPEGDTIFRAARTLNRALAGNIVTGFESVFPKLTRVEFDAGVVGRTVEQVSAQGKWLRMNFSGDLILLTHMLMSGSWHIYPARRNLASNSTRVSLGKTLFESGDDISRERPIQSSRRPKDGVAFRHQADSVSF